MAVVLRAEQPESPLTREALRRDVSLPNLTLLKLIRDRYAHALRLAEAGVERGRAEASTAGSVTAPPIAEGAGVGRKRAREATTDEA